MMVGIGRAVLFAYYWHRNTSGLHYCPPYSCGQCWWYVYGDLNHWLENK